MQPTEAGTEDLRQFVDRYTTGDVTGRTRRQLMAMATAYVQKSTWKTFEQNALDLSAPASEVSPALVTAASRALVSQKSKLGEMEKAISSAIKKWPATANPECLAQLENAQLVLDQAKLTEPTLSMRTKRFFKTPAGIALGAGVGVVAIAAGARLLQERKKRAAMNIQVVNKMIHKGVKPGYMTDKQYFSSTMRFIRRRGKGTPREFPYDYYEYRKHDLGLYANWLTDLLAIPYDDIHKEVKQNLDNGPAAMALNSTLSHKEVFQILKFFIENFHPIIWYPHTANPDNVTLGKIYSALTNTEKHTTFYYQGINWTGNVTANAMSVLTSRILSEMLGECRNYTTEMANADIASLEGDSSSVVNASLRCKVEVTEEELLNWYDNTDLAVVEAWILTIPYIALENDDPVFKKKNEALLEALGRSKLDASTWKNLKNVLQDGSFGPIFVAGNTSGRTADLP
jgi:hypothetical protein